MRYADDIVCSFEHEADAQRFRAELQQRMEKFALSLHPDKTRLIEFGRFAATNRARRGVGKPETFNFLGFTHICGRSRRGLFQLKRKSRRDRMRAKLRAINEDCGDVCTNLFRSRVDGCAKWWAVTSPTTRYQLTSQP